MTKEYLEALKTIKIKCHPNSNPSPLVDEALDIIEQSLQRLEAIDNANPSEALKKLDIIENVLWDTDFHYQKSSKELDIIYQSLLKAQEQENKKYLEWEDLETYSEDLRVDLKVSLNGTKYRLSYFKNDTLKLLTNDKDFYLEIENKQFFNDLHLELLDNE